MQNNEFKNKIQKITQVSKSYWKGERGWKEAVITPDYFFCKYLSPLKSQRSGLFSDNKSIFQL